VPQATLRASVPTALVKPKAIAHFHVLRGYEALARDDVFTAAYHARLVLELEPWRAEALLLHAICRASSGEKGGLTKFFELPATRSDECNGWMMAWLACLNDDFGNGEFWLINLIRFRSKDASVRALLAICQFANGRERQALDSINNALDLILQQSDLAPTMRIADEACYRFILAKNLIKLGKLKEARPQLIWLAEHRADARSQGGQLIGLDAFAVDQEELKWQIGQEGYGSAASLAKLLAMERTAPNDQIAIGNVLWESCDEVLLLIAQGCYERALQSGLYPNAKVALAQIEAFRGEDVVARALLLDALNTRAERPHDSVSPELLLEWVFRELRDVDDAPPFVMPSWSVAFDVTGLKLQKNEFSILCLAPNEAHARAQGEEILAALAPGEPVAERIQVSKACAANQNDQPKIPGLHRVAWGDGHF